MKCLWVRKKIDYENRRTKINVNRASILSRFMLGSIPRGKTAEYLPGEYAGVDTVHHQGLKLGVRPNSS